jgi:hypothetical protein
MRRALAFVSALLFALSDTAAVAPAYAQTTPPPTTRPTGPVPPQVVGRPQRPSRPSRPPPGFFRPGRGHRWVVGNHLWHWSNYRHVPWQQHRRLSRPPRGHYWVRADNAFLLIHARTGRVVRVVWR